MIEGNSVKKVVVKADISFKGWSGYPDYIIIPYLTVEASFKGSNTSNVTNMEKMFNGRRSLTSLDISSFDTSNVTNMCAMFYGCSGLTSLNLSNFNTSKVTDMSGMFQNCANLESLDLSNFDTSKVTDMSNMFLHNAKLSTIKMVGCSKATIDKIKAQLTTDGIINNVTIVTE